MPAVDLRPRSTGELLDATFSIYRNHFKQFITLSLMLFIPSFLAQLANPAVGYTPGTPVNSDWAMLYTPLAIMMALMFMIMESSVALLTSSIYLGNETTPAGAFRSAWKLKWSIVGASIGKTLILGLGFLLFLIPGFIFFAWYFALPIIVVLENLTTGEAFTRSRKLGENHKWHITKVLGVIWLIYLLLAGIGEALAGYMGNLFVIAAVSAACTAFFLPLPAITATLLYYDMRIKNEGFDIEMMSKDAGIGQTAPVPVTPAPQIA